jgi:hypothetical protein
MSYVLAAIAGVWMADGLALLVAPQQLIARVREALTMSPTVLRWEAIAATLGVLLIVGAAGLPYQPLWAATGAAMIAKGAFLAWGPSRWREPVVQWCLHREPVDYRFWGLGLCTLAVLLLHALGWFGAER